MLSESTFDEVNVQKKFPTHSKMNRKYYYSDILHQPSSFISLHPVELEEFLYLLIVPKFLPQNGFVVDVIFLAAIDKISCIFFCLFYFTWKYCAWIILV